MTISCMYMCFKHKLSNKYRYLLTSLSYVHTHTGTWVIISSKKLMTQWIWSLINLIRSLDWRMTKIIKMHIIQNALWYMYMYEGRFTSDTCTCMKAGSHLIHVHVWRPVHNIRSSKHSVICLRCVTTGSAYKMIWTHVACAGIEIISIPAYAHVATRVQIILYALPIAMLAQAYIVNRPLE